MKIHRHLAPTAAPVSWVDIGRGIVGLFAGRRYREVVERDLKRHFGVRHLYMMSSGKGALAAIVSALAARSSRRKVVIPAYTCFSVPSAIVRAGCQVAVCDVDPQTMDFDYRHLQSVLDAETLCIISPHLLGQVSDIAQVRALARPHGILVVEDAAQAMGAMHGGQFLGTQGDVGIFSLGRGKNVTAGSGGIILTNSNEVADALSLVMRHLPEPSMLNRLVNIAMVAAMRLLIYPRMYWLPAGLPFLGLGETKFDPEFPVERLDGSRAGLLVDWRRRLEESNKVRMDRGRQYRERIGGDLHGLGPCLSADAVYLRVPVVMPTADSKRALCQWSAKEGFGVSALYPAPVSEIPALKPGLNKGELPGAKILADRLATLPVHQYVEDSDVARISIAVRTVATVVPVREKQSGSVNDSRSYQPEAVTDPSVRATCR